jgi:hypothetical protein
MIRHYLIGQASPSDGGSRTRLSVVISDGTRSGPPFAVEVISDSRIVCKRKVAPEAHRFASPSSTFETFGRASLHLNMNRPSPFSLLRDTVRANRRSPCRLIILATPHLDGIFYDKPHNLTSPLARTCTRDRRCSRIMPTRRSITPIGPFSLSSCHNLTLF